MAKIVHPKISQEFRDILPPLSSAELASLEADVLKRGLLHPIIVWNGICIDGMHRLGICKKHNIPYKIKQLQFKNKEEAKVWVFEHQNGRRNQTIFGKITAGLQFEDYYRELAKTNQRQSSGRGQKGRPKVDNKINTLGIIAQKVGVARGYVAYAKYIIENANKETIEQCHQGDLSIKNAYLKAKDQARRNRRQKTADANITFQNPQGEYINQIICGDCIKVMQKMVKSGLEGKISLIVFSPNYNNGSNYGNKHNDYYRIS